MEKDFTISAGHHSEIAVPKTAIQRVSAGIAHLMIVVSRVSLVEDREFLL